MKGKKEGEEDEVKKEEEREREKEKQRLVIWIESAIYSNPRH